MQQKKSRPEGNQAPNLAPKSFTSWFNSYKPLNTSREQILMQVEGRNLLQNPGPMRALVEWRNMPKYYKFDKDMGHDTIECFQLRDQIEAMIQGGYLQEYISWLVIAGRQNANAPCTLAPANNGNMSNLNDGPPHEVCTISRGHCRQ